MNCQSCQNCQKRAMTGLLAVLTVTFRAHAKRECVSTKQFDRTPKHRFHYQKPASVQAGDVWSTCWKNVFWIRLTDEGDQNPASILFSKLQQRSGRHVGLFRAPDQHVDSKLAPTRGLSAKCAGLGFERSQPCPNPDLPRLAGSRPAWRTEAPWLRSGTTSTPVQSEVEFQAPARFVPVLCGTPRRPPRWQSAWI